MITRETIFFLCLVAMCHLTSGGKNALDWRREEIKWNTLKSIKDLQRENREITVTASLTFIRIKIGKFEIWSENFPAKRDPKGDRLGYYASVTVLIINLAAETPKIKANRKFMTGQPSESHKLVNFMKSLQQGHLGILIGTPDFLKNMFENDTKFLADIGSGFISAAERGDHWLLVWETETPFGPPSSQPRISNKTLLSAEEYLYQLEAVNHRGDHFSPSVKVLAETLLQVNGNSSVRSTVSVSLYAPIGKGFNCSWDDSPDLKLQHQFCSSYDGYDNLCSCENTYIPSNRTKPKSISMREIIPIAIVTANKPHNLYRILKNLDIVNGLGETPVLVVIDDYQEEVVKLVQLFKLDFKLHSPQGYPKDNTRTNMNIGFAAWSVFDHFPQADKAIILEDDLLLSPDLISFFHQTSYLLDEDKTLSHVNAFGQNSYPLTAADLSTVLRAEMYPQYGWMTTRRWFNLMSSYWAKEGRGVDWDWWLFMEGVKMGLESVVPEVSRTAHAGSAGAHVSGFRQFYYFTTRVLSNSFHTLPVIHTERISPRVRYHQWMTNEIKTATKLKLTGHPCDYNIFPENKTGPFVLYMGSSGRDDKTNSYYLMQTCLGTDETDLKEIYDGVMRLNVLPYSRPLNTKEKRRILYIVGCPLSSLCIYSIEIVDWIYPSDDMLENLPNRGFFRKYVRL